MLWMAAAAQGHACPMWMTFRQAKEHGGFVRKGETGALVVYANSFTATETDEDGEESERERSEEHTSELQSLMRISYAVFCLKKKKTNNHITIKKRDTEHNTPLDDYTQHRQNMHITHIKPHK